MSNVTTTQIAVASNRGLSSKRLSPGSDWELLST